MPNSVDASSAREVSRTRMFTVAIVAGGVIAGTVDIGAASLINSLSPRIILEAIASGVLGAASFRGGVPVQLLGLGLQWSMSLIITAIYVVAASRWASLARHALRGGVAYGMVIYLVMNYVVVPLSAAPFSPSRHPFNVAANVLAMILFGLIVATVTQLSGITTRVRHRAPGA